MSTSLKKLKILVLCKRQYTGRDLLDDQYGRLFEIPEALANRGISVTGITLSYRNKPTGSFVFKKVRWHSINGLPFSPLTFVRQLRKISKVIKTINPDIIWASSDAWHIQVAAVIAKKNNIPFIADLYDNYESFLISKLPLVTTLYRFACSQAIGITSVTDTLSRYVARHTKCVASEIKILGNGINPELFYPRDKIQARNFLKLPQEMKLIGTAGALTSSRGINILLNAFEKLSAKRADVRLVLAGPRDSIITNYKNPNLIDLGIINPAKVPHFLSSLDVAVICNKDSSFGRYCYPQKLEEISACQTSCLAADVGELPALLLGHPDNLFKFNSPEDLSDKINLLLMSKKKFVTPVNSWTDRADALYTFMQQCLAKHPCYRITSMQENNLPVAKQLNK